MEPEPPTSEDLRRQQQRQAEDLAEMQRQEELREQQVQQARAAELQDQARQAFKRQAEEQAEDAKRRQEQTAKDEARRSQEGEIASASARYSIALGQHYDVRDPYGSLAQAAMAEYAALVKGQEELRQAIAREQDSEKRRLLELRKEIEAHDYMAITSQRLAGISATIAGREDAPQAILHGARAEVYAERATELRDERAGLIAAREQREQQERQQRDAGIEPGLTADPVKRAAEARQTGGTKDADDAARPGIERKDGADELSDEQRAKLERSKATRDYYAQHNAQKQKDRDRGGGGRSGR